MKALNVKKIKKEIKMLRKNAKKNSSPQYNSYGATRVTKFKSRNLLGESRKEEVRRLSKARTKAILSGKSPEHVREIKFGGKGYLKGTTPSQRRKRRKILKEVY